MKKLKIYSVVVSIIIVILILGELKRLHDFKPSENVTVYTITLTNKTDKNINELSFSTEDVQFANVELLDPKTTVSIQFDTMDLPWEYNVLKLTYLDYAGNIHTYIVDKQLVGGFGFDTKVEIINITDDGVLEFISEIEYSPEYNPE